MSMEIVFFSWLEDDIRAAIPGAAALVDVEGVPDGGDEAGQLALQLHAAAGP